VFGSYLFILRRRLVNIVVLMLPLVPLAFLYLTSRPPVYESRAVLEVDSGSLTEVLLGVSRPYEEPVRRVASIADVVTSRPVEEIAAGILVDQGRAPKGVKAEPRRASNYIDITATGSTPNEANAVASAYAIAFFQHRTEEQQEELEELEDGLVERQEAAERQLAAARSEDPGSPDEAAAAENLDSTTRLLQTVRLRQDIPPTGINLQTAAASSPRPTNELSPILAMLLSMVGVFFVASGITLLLELIRDAIRTRDEVERLTPAPVLGEIVRNRTGSAAADAPRESDLRSGSRMVRLGLLARSGGSLPASVLVTALPDDLGDGLLAAAALAEGCSDSGQRVLLVADVPPGSATRLQPVGRPAAKPGELALASVEGYRFAWCAATSADGRLGLLDLPVPKQAIDDLLASFDLVILAPGTPALLPTDLAYLTAATVVVCSIGRTHGRRFARFLEVIERETGPVRGVILTLPPPIVATPKRWGILPRRRVKGAAPVAGARPAGSRDVPSPGGAPRVREASLATGPTNGDGDGRGRAASADEASRAPAAGRVR
jgi:capsular polysaccharide biosynthesis protein